jgi:hypothetical protein
LKGAVHIPIPHTLLAQPGVALAGVAHTLPQPLQFMMSLVMLISQPSL